MRNDRALKADRASGIVIPLTLRLAEVKDTERDLADCVGAIYQAGTGDGSWFDVGERIVCMPWTC